MDEVDDAVDGGRELRRALAQAGVPFTDGPDPDILVIDGEPRQIRLERVAVVTATSAQSAPALESGQVGMFIADRVSEAARQVLAERGWGWLDRRGHLRLWAPGTRIDTTFESWGVGRPDRFASLFPPVGVEVSLALLKQPSYPWTVTKLSLVLDRAAGGVSERLRALREAGLVDRRGRPATPELFWELVDAWGGRVLGLHRAPGVGASAPEGGDDGSWLGIPSRWVVTDTQAALALGAPVLASAGDPPDFYVPSQSILDLAVSHYGPAQAGQAAATVRLARYHGIADDTFEQPGSPFPVAHPVVVALDLAQDRSRGREIVEAWDPTDLGVDRVW